MMRIFIIQVHDPVIHLEVDEEQKAITQGGKRQAERTGFLVPYLACQGYDTQIVVFTLKTVLTSIQYPSLPYSSRQRNEFPWSQANPK